MGNFEMVSKENIRFLGNKIKTLRRIKSATQDRYRPDQFGSRQPPMVWKKNWFAPSVWPMAISVCSVWSTPIFRSVRPGQYPSFGLFGLANTHISVCLVVRSGQYLVARALFFFWGGGSVLCRGTNGKDSRVLCGGEIINRGG